jgi:ABC-type lipoprotein release transport system permease subunit
MASMEKVFKLTGVDDVTVTAASYDQVESLATRLRQALGAQFEVDTQTAKYRDVFSALQVAQQSIQVAWVISLIIAAAVIIFAVLQLVRERISEIAILKALGTSHLQVLWQFWIEILTLSTTAAAFAIFLLATLGTFIAQRFDIDPASLVKSNTGPGKGPGSGGLFLSSTGPSGNVTASTDTNPLSNIHLGAATLNPQTLLIIVGLVVGLALLASFIPIWFVSTLKPAQVLRKAS